MELRPLGFAEIFDRAVTLYVRNFVAFAAVVMVLVLPISILQYFLDRGSQPELDALIALLQHPGRPPGHIPTIFDSPVMIALVIVSSLVAYLLWPFALNAVAVGVARIYRGRSPSFRECYAVVLRRGWQIVGVVFVDFLVVIAWYFVTVIVIVAMVAVIAAFGAISPGFAFVFGVIVALIGFAVMLPLLAPLFVALTFSMYATVIEDCGVIESVQLGFARVFNRREFWRAMLFAVATGATLFGGYAMFGAVGLIAAFLHQPALQATIESVSRAAISPFGVVLLAIYYFDVRIRREGYDLENSLERLAASQPA